MISIATLVLLVGLAAGPSAGQQRKEIFLPADVDLLTVVGNGFKLELSQFDLAKRKWNETVEEAKKVEQPRGAQQQDDDSQVVVVNENLFQKTKKEQEEEEEAANESSPKDYGQLDEPLLRWIQVRATSLLERAERHHDEMGQLGGGQKIVLNVLLLNTIVNLNNLAKEKISSLKWLRTKLAMLLKQHIDKDALVGETQQFVEQLVAANKHTESKLRGTNEPPKEWMRNSQAIKRILTEQRFSEALSKLIIGYFAGHFNLMSRSAVYQTFKPAKRLDDGLYYPGAAKLSVSRNLPFAAQDAIANGAQV